MKTVAIIALFLVGTTLALNGFKEVDVNDPEVVKCVEAGLEKRNSDNESLYYKKAVKVVSAQVQSFTGTLYEIEVILGETHCAKEDEGAELCPIDNNGQQEVCVFKVEKSRAYKAKVYGVDCSDL